MNKIQKEYIALYLFVFGAILIFGVLARKVMFVKGYDEFSVVVGFFATVVVLSTLYISPQMTLNEFIATNGEVSDAFSSLSKVGRGNSCCRVHSYR